MHAVAVGGPDPKVAAHIATLVSGEDAELQAFYTARDYRPAWARSPAIGAFATAVAALAGDGLTPQHYGAEELAAHWAAAHGAAAGNDTAAGARAQAALDEMMRNEVLQPWWVLGWLYQPALFQDTVNGGEYFQRTIRGEMNIAPGRKLPLYLRGGNTEDRARLDAVGQQARDLVRDDARLARAGAGEHGSASPGTPRPSRRRRAAGTTTSSRSQLFRR